MNRLFMALMFLGTFFTAISQILLKQSANRTWKNTLSEYLNWRVILAYTIFFGVLLLNTYAYTKVDMKYGSIIDTCSYIFVMILSVGILKERISRGKLIGNLVILTGIFLYTLPL
ncbi:MAG: DMT family transporter [Clostridiales bacterium]|nr:DMT family transporter [Clostridiales bacterium]